jgi:hypothetical protein
VRNQIRGYDAVTYKDDSSGLNPVFNTGFLEETFILRKWKIRGILKKNKYVVGLEKNFVFLQMIYLIFFFLRETWPFC